MRLKTVACLVVAVLNTVAMAQTPSQLSSSVVGRDSALVDWPQFQFDAAHTGYNPYEVILSPQTVGNLVLAWQTHGGYDNIPSSPSVANGVLYYGTGDNGYLLALDAQTGTGLWSAILNPTMVGTPAVAYGNVYVNSSSGQSGIIHALNAVTGGPWWNASDGGAPSDVAVTDGVVYVASVFDSIHPYEGLYALDTNTGQFLWQNVGVDEQAPSSGDVPTVANNSVYVACGLGLCAFDAATGMMQWHYSPPEGTHFSVPSVSNGVLYVGAFLDLDDGDFIALNLYALDAATGTLLWQVPLKPTLGPRQEYVVVTAPAVANNIVYIGGGSTNISVFGEMYAIDAITGAHLWQYHTTAPVTSPAVANGVVYFGTQDGTAYALDADNGTPLWKYSIGSAVRRSAFGFSSPIVVNGMLYIGSTEWMGRIYAFHLPNQ